MGKVRHTGLGSSAADKRENGKLKFKVEGVKNEVKAEKQVAETKNDISTHRGGWACIRDLLQDVERKES